MNFYSWSPRGTLIRMPLFVLLWAVLAATFSDAPEADAGEMDASWALSDYLR